MGIIVQNTKPSEFSTPPNPIYREFKTDKQQINHSTRVGVKPDNDEISVSLRNYGDLDMYGHYDNFRLSYTITGDDFIQVVGLDIEDPITTASKEFQISYYNFSLKTDGKYQSKISLFVLADNEETGRVDVLEQQEILIDMDVDTMDLAISQTEVFVQHTKDAMPSWVLNLDVTCSDVWELLNGDMQNNSALLINDSSDQHMYFSGDQTIALSFSPDVNELEIGYHQLKVYFYQPSLVAELTIHLVVSEDAYLSITPDRLDFEAIRYYQEADWKSVVVYSQDAIQGYTAPAWCEVGEVTIQGFDEFVRIDVKPILSHNLLPGTYTGNLVIEIDSENHFIPIEHVVHGVYDSTYDKEVHFTLDNDILKLFSQSLENTYVELIGEIKIYQFDGSQKTATRKWQLAFLNNVAEINLGRELDDYLYLLDAPKFSGPKLSYMYKPMSIKLTAREIRYEDEQMVQINRLPFQYYLRGRKPITGKKSFMLWHNLKEPVRVTPNSLISINVFKGYGFPMDLQIKRNGELFETILYDGSQDFAQPIFMGVTYDLKKIENLYPGEVLSFAYNGNQRDYIVIPEQPNSITIGWVNQFELMDTFEFTGAHELPIEYNSSTSKNYIDWNEVLRKIDSSKSQKLILNTGWIFKTNTRIIDEIIDSKKAFWILNSGFFTLQQLDGENYVSLVPISKKLSGVDSKKNLYQYEVEFQINRKYEDAVYL